MTNSSDPTTIWQHLLFTDISHDKIISAIRNALENNGYKSYDPFPGGSGSPIGKLTRLRTFVAPSDQSWQSLFIAPTDSFETSILSDLAKSIGMPFLDLRIQSLEAYQITLYDTASSSTDLAALVPFLKSGLTIADLESSDNEAISISDSSPSNAANLPSELQQFADDQGVEGKHINKLMGRMTKRIFKKMEQQSGDASDDTQEQAKAMLAGQSQDVLSSLAGQKLRNVLACLTVPDDWYLPDWKSLVAAYPIARQLQKGDGLLLPGDESTLNQVPDALDYTPLYYAKKH